MSEWAAKRFWKTTEVTSEGEGFTVTLDGRSVRTPAKTLLTVPTQALAQAIATEWDAQGEKIDPLSMPYTRAANAALDKVAHQKAEVAEMLAAYGDSDLTCYRADAPEGLVARQAEGWDPLLEWAASHLGAQLVPQTGVMHQPQDPAALARLKAQVDALTTFQLTAFHDLVSLSGSLVIGFAATQNFAGPERLWELSRIDESWQEEQWGEDEEATQMAGVKREAFLHADRFFRIAA